MNASLNLEELLILKIRRIWSTNCPWSNRDVTIEACRSRATSQVINLDGTALRAMAKCLIEKAKDPIRFLQQEFEKDEMVRRQHQRNTKGKILVGDVFPVLCLRPRPLSESSHMSAQTSFPSTISVTGMRPTEAFLCLTEAIICFIQQKADSGRLAEELVFNAIADDDAEMADMVETILKGGRLFLPSSINDEKHPNVTRRPRNQHITENHRASARRLGLTAEETEAFDYSGVLGHANLQMHKVRGFNNNCMVNLEINTAHAALRIEELEQLSTLLARDQRCRLTKGNNLLKNTQK